MSLVSIKKNKPSGGSSDHSSI